MKAFILAAGLGTRLYPFTSDRPKALVELAGVTLLERAIRKVKEIGVSEIVINIHHFGSKIIDYLEANQNFHIPVSFSDERGQLLDTGGAILRARPFLDDKKPFLVYNVDVLSSIQLPDMLAFHQQKGGLVTMAVRKRITDRYLVFNQEMKLSGWRNVKSGEEVLVRKGDLIENYAFSGIQIIQPELFPLITESGKFSLIQMYLRLAAINDIYGFHDKSDFWMDLGKPDQLLAAEHMMR
jgi:NDP-sugar pyrophosphorylase family protein